MDARPHWLISASGCCGKEGSMIRWAALWSSCPASRLGHMVLPSVGAASMAASSLSHWQCHGDGYCPRRDGPSWPNLFLVWGLVLVRLFVCFLSRYCNLQSYNSSGYSHYPRSNFASLPQLILCSGKEVGESIETICYCRLSHSLNAFESSKYIT